MNIYVSIRSGSILDTPQPGGREDHVRVGRPAGSRRAKIVSLTVSDRRDEDILEIGRIAADT